MAGVYFCLGFLFTNICFQISSAAFVETIKAAEPITSAVIAVMWGIEVMGPPEMVSLGCIVAGCLLSTIGRSEEGGMRCVRVCVCAWCVSEYCLLQHVVMDKDLRANLHIVPLFF
jgi:hypothetical protein